MSRALIVSLAALVACGPTVPEDLAAALTERGGCGDLIVYAYDTDDSLLLTVVVDGLVDAAQIAGEEQTTTHEIGDPGVQVGLDVGSRITDAICDDVIENGGPVVRRTLDATAGTIEVTVRPGDDAWGARADVDITGVVLEDAAPLDLSWTDIAVGWLAG